VSISQTSYQFQEIVTAGLVNFFNVQVSSASTSTKLSDRFTDICKSVTEASLVKVIASNSALRASALVKSSLKAADKSVLAIT